MKPFAEICPDQYNYDLPEHRIAFFPAEIRDHSRLLVRNRNGSIREDLFSNIASYLPENSHLFFNNSKVIPARLVFTKETGSRIEIFCLKPVEPMDYTLALSSTSTSTWECMIGNLKRFNKGLLRMKCVAENAALTLSAEKISQTGNIAVVRFAWENDDLSFAEILAIIGKTPLPPYIKRNPEAIDRERYQTVYSKYDGSVAAPTAGLHFTEAVLEQLAGRHITCHEVTLHVGAGTFQPIKASSVSDHEMHAEYFGISIDLVQQLVALTGKVMCVGTTSVRTLESIYWLGVKTAETPHMSPRELQLGQWESYLLPSVYSAKQSFEALGKWMEHNGIKEMMASTKLMIVPGYRFNMADTLITNFHQPRSTLLLLIAAFIGESWKEVYQYALQHDFRFLSYGDSSLLFNQPVS